VGQEREHRHSHIGQGLHDAASSPVVGPAIFKGIQFPNFLVRKFVVIIVYIYVLCIGKKNKNEDK